MRPGHSAGHQIVWIGDGDDAALYTADLAPAKIWLDPNLIAGVDTDPEAARKNRIEVLSEAEERGAPVILYHEPQDSLVKVRSEGDGFKAVPSGVGSREDSRLPRPPTGTEREPVVTGLACSPAVPDLAPHYGRGDYEGASEQRLHVGSSLG